jgi:ribonuclease P protein component
MRNHEKNISAKQAETKENSRIPHPHENQKRPQSDRPPTSQGQSRIDRLKFPKKARLRLRREFQAAKLGKRFVGKYLCVDFRLAGKTARLGISASSKFGDAPERNRFKRLVREAFRLNFSRLVQGDFHVIPRKFAKSATLDQIIKELLQSAGHDPQP